MIMQRWRVIGNEIIDGVKRGNQIETSEC